MRVKGGHHEGRGYFALGCKLDPFFLVIAASFILTFVSLVGVPLVALLSIHSRGPVM